MKRLVLATIAVVVVAFVVGIALWAAQRSTVPKGKAEVTGLRTRSGGTTPLEGAVAFRDVSANVISSPVIITVNTDKDGKFTKDIPAGQYEVAGTNDGDCTPIDLTLKSGAKQTITLTCVK